MGEIPNRPNVQFRCGEPEDGDYCELLDENDPNGAVVIRRKDGRPTLVMSRSAYDELEASLGHRR